MDSKTLLVLSDTHGSVHTLEAVLKWAKSVQGGGTVGTAVFLGDGIRDISRVAAATGFSREWKLIRGNNDDVFSVPEAAVLDFCGHRFFLCHGHRHSLYGGYHSLIAAARNMEADTVLFGHTHVPYCGNIDGIRLINPGSIGNPRSKAGATFALIDCAEGEPADQGSAPGKPFETRFWRIGPEGKIFSYATLSL